MIVTLVIADYKNKENERIKHVIYKIDYLEYY